MRYNQLGRTGLFVSELCLGTMTFGGAGTGLWEKIGTLEQEPVDALVKRALDAGINFIDTADVYSQGHSEELLGQSLRNLGVKRSDVVIATKFHGATGEGPNDRGGSRGHIMDAVERSLERLQTDHIDLYQIHGYDTVTPPEETLRALDDLVQSRARPLRRLLELAGMADREGAGDFGASRLGALRDDAVLLHDRRPRPRARGRAAAHRGGRRPAGLEPARRRPALRQVRARRARGQGCAPRELRLPAGRPRAGVEMRRGDADDRAMRRASRWRGSRSPGCSPSRT